jgi:hypothetical protein
MSRPFAGNLPSLRYFRSTSSTSKATVFQYPRLVSTVDLSEACSEENGSALGRENLAVLNVAVSSLRRE